MKKLFLVSLAVVQVWACAGAQSDGSDGTGGVPGSGGSGSGGTVGSGGKAGLTGGSANSGGTMGTGGAQNSGGTVGSGGAASGGSESSGGNASGGSGGSGSGGDGSGGAPQYEGDCADKPTWATWHTSSEAASGDLVIFQCTKPQSECEAYMIGEDYLFECTDSHANNCKTQKPEEGSAWTVIDSCENLGFGGMGGMGGMGGGP